LIDIRGPTISAIPLLLPSIFSAQILYSGFVVVVKKIANATSRDQASMRSDCSRESCGRG
jgi:hypothetical protein